MKLALPATMVAILGTGILAVGVCAADAPDVKALQAQLKDAKGKLSAFERGRIESASVQSARAALDKAVQDDKAKAEADLKAKPEAAEIAKKIEDLAKQRQDAENKMREIRKAVEAKPEVVALQKAVQDAAAAHRAKIEELVKADASLAELQKGVDAARAAEGEAHGKLIQVRLSGNADVAALKAKIAELEAAVAATTPPKKPAEPKKDKPKEEAKK